VTSQIYLPSPWHCLLSYFFTTIKFSYVSMGFPPAYSRSALLKELFAFSMTAGKLWTKEASICSAVLTSASICPYALLWLLFAVPRKLPDPAAKAAIAPATMINTVTNIVSASLANLETGQQAVVDCPNEPCLGEPSVLKYTIFDLVPITY
jgi:hypothetical protein